MTSFGPGAIWALVVLIGVGTWMIRLSFVALFGRVDTIPPTVMRILALIPAAVLAAIVAPALTHSSGSLDLGTDRFFAGVMAALVARRTKNVLATIGVGMGALWILQLIG